jgi:hypothetical protein
MSHKLGVCVPYRNRELHMNEFIPKIGKYLKNQDIDFQIYIVHQVDDKLFNRGATKNIGAKHAFEEGCDYVVWHDIDMIPEEGGGCDYSYPADAPRHIATQISQMNYELKYHEYFGGAVLFTKEQVEATNGYSNDYWDWGMEDDDLFWRCHLEGMTNDSYIPVELNNQKYLSFNGENSYAKIPYQREYRGLTTRSHTISALVRCYQQPDKNRVFLIGDDKRKYVEYPILRLPGYDYGLSFNNSRAVSYTFWNSFNKHNYMWLKRYDKQWSWVTAVLDEREHLAHLYLNGTEIDSKVGLGSPSPLRFDGKLKSYGTNDFYLGMSPSEAEESSFKYFKGDIAKVQAWNRALTPLEVKSLHAKTPTEGLTIDLDLNKEENNLEIINAETRQEDLRIPNSIIPHRVEGRMRCLPHPDEGIVDGKFVKGETTARNERRYVLEMQKGSWDYKGDGIKQLKYELVKETKLTPWAKMLDIKL